MCVDYIALYTNEIKSTFYYEFQGLRLKLYYQ